MSLTAQVTALYVGSIPGLEKVSQSSLEVKLEGIVGDKHGGFIRGADSRNREYPRASPMRNDRQWSAVSPEELAVIARNLGVPKVEAGWVGANLSLSGIPNFSDLPKGTKLIFPQGVVFVVETINNPCVGPGEVIANKYPDKLLQANQFPKAAFGKRGVVGVIERAGMIHCDDLVTVLVYEPKAYSLPSPV